MTKATDETRALPCDTLEAWRWLLHFANREPEEARFLPAARHDQVLALHPDAVAALPLAEDIPYRRPLDGLRELV